MSAITLDVLAANVVAMWAEETLGLTTEQASQLCDRISDEVRERVRTLEADNAALLSVIIDAGNAWRSKRKPDALFVAISMLSGGGHPGAALLAEMERFRPVADLLRQYQRRDYATPLATLERLLSERSRIATAHMVSSEQMDSLRARVAELERAATIARDAALEEAAEHADGGPLHVRGVLMKPSERIRALKAQPARRFVDAEEVVGAVRRMIAPDPNEGPMEWDAALVSLLERLGLTLDGETT